MATSAVRSIARSWLTQVGFSLPRALVTVDDVVRGKPAPDPYLLAAERLGMSAARCLVVEDAPAGITAAKAAGATVLAVRTTHRDSDLGEADAVVDGVGDVTITVERDHIDVSWQAAASGTPA